MVFPGRFSTGCKLCRRRKLKCDQGKPSCRRCLVYGKPCPGYTDEFQFRHNQKHPDSPAPESTQLDIPADWLAERASNPCTWQVHIPRAVPERSYEHAHLCYFVRRIVSTTGANDYPGYFSFLPNLLNHRDHGVLELAALSVAQISAFNQFRDRRFLQHAYRNHGRAIRCLRDQIRKNDHANDDKSIAAILLLCTFSDIGGEDVGSPTAHIAGLFYLLQSRGLEQLATDKGFELFVLALVRLQTHAFAYDTESPIDPNGLLCLIELMGSYHPLLRALYLTSKTLNLRLALIKYLTTDGKLSEEPASLSDCTDKTPHSEEDAATEEEQLIQTCFQVLDEHDSWDVEAAAYWKTSLQDRPEPLSVGEAAKCIRFYDPQTACTVILMRSSRLIQLISLLEFIQRSGRSAASSPCRADASHQSQWVDLANALTSDVRSTIDDMLWCVPYALGDIDAIGNTVLDNENLAGGLVITQPIRLVTYCQPYATQEQILASEGILKRFNEVMGIKSATACDDPAIGMAGLGLVV